MTTEFIDGSRVLEIDPASRSIQWQYTAELSGRPLWTFRTSVGGDAQRLPNGTTLITECVTGRIFQGVCQYRAPQQHGVEEAREPTRRLVGLLSR